MTQARTNILNKLKNELNGVTPESVQRESVYNPPQLPKGEWLAVFTQHLEANNAIVKHINENEVETTIVDFLKQQNINKLMLGSNQWSDKLIAYNKQENHNLHILPCYNNLSEEKHNVFNTVPASFTTSVGAIAATGTIVLMPDVAEPRALSLIPPVHIVLVKKSELFADLSSVIKVQKWNISLPTNVVLLSGPSKTADIQQTLAYGAHGPKKLLVLVI